jgi:hypothetical protein
VSPIWQTLSDNRQHVTGFHCSNCDYTWKWEHKNRKAAGKNEDGILEWYQHTSRTIPIRWSIAARSAVKWKCLRSNKNWLEEQGWRISVFLSERLYIRGLTSIFFLDSQSFRTCEIVTVGKALFHLPRFLPVLLRRSSSLYTTVSIKYWNYNVNFPLILRLSETNNWKTLWKVQKYALFRSCWGDGLGCMI